MAITSSSVEPTWWVFALTTTLHTHNLFTTCLFLSLLIILLTWTFSSGGPAWRNGRAQMGRVSIPGPRGLPFFGSLFSLSRGLPHRTLAYMASTSTKSAKQLMALSLGSTPVVVTSDPVIAREILTSNHFANRPIKQSAKDLMFARAIGFAPNGLYWRSLRRITSIHLFSPKRIQAHQNGRLLDSDTIIENITKEHSIKGGVILRKHLQIAALNNIMGSVFGKRYDDMEQSEEARELNEMVREGFELLGAFNWSDHLPWLNYFYDPYRMKERCSVLVPRVRKFVKGIIEEHQLRGSKKLSDDSDFVDVLLSSEGEEKLHMDDMIAVLWVRLYLQHFA